MFSIKRASIFFYNPMNSIKGRKVNMILFDRKVNHTEKSNDMATFTISTKGSF